MRRPPLAGAVLLLLALGRSAAAFDFRALAAIDGMATFAPGSGQTTDGEIGIHLRGELLRLANRVDLKADFWGRLGIEGNPSSQELRELSLRIRNLGGRVDLTLGRFLTPGGFWLIADGARLDLRYASWLTHSVYGGLRAFTTDRRNADLAVDNFIALPLAGTALDFHHAVFDLSLSFTWAREALDLQNALDAKGQLVLERHVENEFFLAGQILATPTPALLIAAGGSLGTRYDIQFSSQDPVSPSTIGVATLGAVSGWGMIEGRPVRALRLQYAINYERVRLIESQLVFTKPNGSPVLAANGDFLDNSVRAAWTVWRSLRLDLQYRLRYRENTDLENHAVLGARGDALWHGLGAFASIGLDVIIPGTATATNGSAVTTQTTRIIYSGGLSFVRATFDVRAGILFTDGVGSGLLFSQQVAAASGGGAGTSPVNLFPYVLESNRIVFVRLFGVHRGFFGGLDVEENLDHVQLRAMAQIGFSR